MNRFVWEIVYVALSTLLFLPFMLRFRAAAKARKRLLLVAKSYRAEAVRRNMENDYAANEVLRAFESLAAVTPLVIADVARPEPRTAEEHSMISEFLNANGWALPYAAAQVYTVHLLCFYAHPFHPGYWFRALLSKVALSLCSRPDGGVELMTQTDRMANNMKVYKGAQGIARLAH